jgi:hypothetical protein
MTTAPNCLTTEQTQAFIAELEIADPALGEWAKERVSQGVNLIGLRRRLREAMETVAKFRDIEQGPSQEAQDDAAV